MTVLDQHHDADRDDRLGHRRRCGRWCRAPSARKPPGFGVPIASNQPIWPRRATITVMPGRVPFSISRLNASDMRCNRTGERPSDSGLAGERRGLRGRGVLCGCLRGHGLSVLLSSLPDRATSIVGVGASRGAEPPVEQRVFRNEPPAVCRRADRWAIVQTEGAGSPAVIRFALAIGASPMLETARIGGDAGSL